MRYPINTVLLTMDGRNIGNAIVVGHDEKVNILMTDYGNMVRATDAEISKFFHPVDQNHQRRVSALKDHKYWIHT